MVNIGLAISPPRQLASRRLADAVRLCVVEARPCVLLVFLLRFLVGSALSGMGAARGDLVRVAETAVVWELAVFAVYLFNGVTDVHEDRINGSQRPIARGALSTAVARWVAAVAAMASIGGAAALGSHLLWAVLALLGLGFCYSSPPIHLKRHAVTSTATGILLGLLTYYAGPSAYTGHGWSHASAALCVFVVGATTWMGLVGGLTKDLSDVAGDVAAGRRTVPGVCGEARARRAVSFAALGLAVGFCAAGAWTSPLLIWPGVAMLGGAIAMAVVCLRRSAHRTRSGSRRPYRVFMTTQYLVNLSVVAPLIGQCLSG